MKRTLIFLALSLMTVCLWAQPVATLLFTRDVVTAKNERGVERKLTRGSKLSVGDSIITGSTANARLRYQNGTVVTLGSNSHYTIKAYAPKSTDVNIRARLVKGKIQSKTAGGKKREALETPTVVLAIVGTEFQVYVPADTLEQTARHPSMKDPIYVRVIEGDVLVRGVKLDVGVAYIVDGSSIQRGSFPSEGLVSASVGSDASGADEVEPALSVADVAPYKDLDLVNSTVIVPTTIIPTIGATETINLPPPLIELDIVCLP